MIDGCKGEGVLPLPYFYFNVMLISILDEEKTRSYWYSLGITPNKVHSSPFRVDRNPSFSIFLNKDGLWTGKDFATGELYSVQRAMRIVKGNTNMNIPPHIVNSYKQSKKGKTFIYIVPCNWTKNSFQYWDDYHIDSSLFPVVGLTPIKKAILVYPNMSTKTLPVSDLSFAYRMPSGNVKIYQPYGEPKWVGNTNKTDVYGIDHLKGTDSLIVTSSAKDLLVLKTHTKLDIIAPNAEYYPLPKELLASYNKVYIWYDNDATGHKRMQELNYNSIIQPLYKDPSDWIKHDKKGFYEYIRELGFLR